MNCSRFLRTALLVVVATVASSAVSADSGDLNRDIQQFLDGYAAAYNRQDYAALLALWDRQDDAPIYMAEEIDPPMHGWQKINAYFARPGVLDGIRNEYTNVDAHYLAPDVAIATYRLRFDIQVKNMKPLSSWDRVMAVFRRKDGQWKLAAYAEAPMAPLTMVRKMLQHTKTLTPEEQKALLAKLLAQLQDSVPADFEQWLKEHPSVPPGR